MHLICQFFTKTRIRAIKHGETRVNLQRERNLMIDDLDNVDFVFLNVNPSCEEALLHIFEDNEVVIKMIIKGRSPTMRHVSRTHRVALDRLLIESIWTPRSKSNTLTPRTNSQTH